MKTNVYLLLCLCLFLTVSCEDEVEPRFSLETTGDVIIDSDIDSQSTVSFTSAREWTAKTDADWVSISPSSGSAGTAEITVTAQSENTTGDVRTAILTLTSGELSKEITLKQAEAEFVQSEKSNYIVAVTGEDLEIRFTTNLTREDGLIIYHTGGDWLIQPAETGSTQTGVIKLTALPNTDKTSRTISIVFSKKEGSEETILNTVKVTQFGSRVIQEASIGEGIPIVIMGDGFLDKDIVDGTYDKVMNKACENIFSEEPIKSLRSYFDVYSVTAVSKSNSFAGGHSTVFNCRLEGSGSTLIEGDDVTVQKYMQCIQGIDYERTMVIVILNSSAYAGTTYFGYTNSSHKRIEFAIAYCPVINNLEHESFRQVLIHEAVGHGFAKLEDEYYYSGTMSLKEINQVKDLQQLGWAQNVDFTKESTEVLWKQFLNDRQYVSEGLGVFEGACTYRYGAYRPSEDSMMGSNTLGFNAPSRKAIYDRIMKEGAQMNPTYEQFVDFDLRSNPQVRTVTRTSVTPGKPFAHPRLVDKALMIE